MATPDSSVTSCKNEPQDPQESKSLFEGDTKRKVTGRKSPPIDHFSENLQTKPVSDVTEEVLPLCKSEAVCQNGQLKESSDALDGNRKDTYGWKSRVVGLSHQRARSEEKPIITQHDCGKIRTTSPDETPLSTMSSSDNLKLSINGTDLVHNMCSNAYKYHTTTYHHRQGCKRQDGK
ncbi:hypothetical protein CB1_000190017 [Camelus ferus]|nr:hypothetical protein CB1_000190017 [Camelus ferus]